MEREEQVEERYPSQVKKDWAVVAGPERSNTEDW